MTTEVQELLEADEVRRSALVSGDLALLDSCLSDDLVLVHTSGALDSKRSLMDKVENRTIRYKSFEHLENSAYIHGSIGVQTTLSQLQVEVGGASKEIRCRTIAIWVTNGGRWVMRQYQTTALPAAPFVSARLDHS